ncbi:MAG: DUF1801 domain-containing protein [Chloroflexota bacterium]|nr:DUF1801 domain-containing protein [Chloroflexota bacterium]
MATKPAKKTAATTATKKAAPKTVAGYIAAAPKEQRAALKKLRKTIKAAAPRATEGLSYGIVGFKQNAKNVAYFGSWKTHVALYGFGGRVIDAHAFELRPYVQSKGTIQFPADEPIPYRLVTKLVKARVAELKD